MNEPKKEIPIGARFRGPGPAKYMLPPTIGFIDHDPTKIVKPAITFGRKTWVDMINKNPPPYFIHPTMTKLGKMLAPAYTMTKRGDPDAVSKNPGPPHYYRERVHPPGEKVAPSYTMNARGDIEKVNQNPAPNAYRPIIGSVKLRHPEYSMNGRQSKGFYYDSPGPAEYRTISTEQYKRMAPQYTMTLRRPIEKIDANRPSPASHRAERVFIHKPRAPVFTMRIKHSEFLLSMLDEHGY